jgi:DNA-binding transcriptional MerR regulator
MDKSPDAFRTISEVAEHLDTPAHVLRFWESRFPQIRPVKRAGGRRYYRPSDVALLAGIKRLLHDEGLTIRGVQKILRDQGVRHVAGLSDESVPVGGVSETAGGGSGAVDADGGGAVDEVPEAGFIEVVDDEPEPEPMPAPPPKRKAPDQPSLPLFDAAPAEAPPAPVAPAPAGRQPTQRDDATFASLIRALPPGRLAAARPEIAALAARLAALRARLAERAETGG